MKLNKILATSVVLSALLAGCSQGVTKSSDSTKKDTNHQTQNNTNNSHSDVNKSHSANQSQNSNNVNSNKETQSTKSGYKSFNQLTKADKIALAALAPQSSYWMFTPNDIINNSGPVEFSNEVDFKETGRPADADIFVSYNCGNGGEDYDFHIKIALNDKQIAVVGEKGAILTYNEIFQYGKVYNLKDLYEKYKNSPELPKVANAITIDETYHADTRNFNPDDESDDTSSSNDSKSSEKVTRANVIDKVEAYEGHKLDTSTYTYKEPTEMGDGRWGFSILDKAGNLEGSYIVNPDGSVEKYDEKGQRI